MTRPPRRLFAFILLAGALSACSSTAMAPGSGEGGTSATTTEAPATGEGRAEINSIVVEDGRYVVDYSVTGFPHDVDPDSGMTHVHFFFDTVTPEQAGVPGEGPWELYGGPNPFTVYRVDDRPPGAEKICVLVANGDHSVQPGTGNCVDLP